MYHFQRLNLQYNINEYCIEFWFKNENYCDNSKIIHHFHVDKDEELFIKNKILKCPILSTVTYLTDSLHPLIISNIKYDDLSNINNIKNKTKEFILFFPKTLKHICFDCKNFHGVINLNNNTDKIITERIVLVFNIWKNYIPIYRNYYRNNSKEKLYNKNDNIIKIYPELNNQILNLTINNNIMNSYIFGLIANTHDKNFYTSNFNLNLIYKNNIVKIKSN